jgi:uncharacterized integral membrane protein
MAFKQCEKCNETVDEAKAFCPACGNSFVEEERRSITTNFEEMDMTVQLGQTMYNQMLSDMGLNVSKTYDAQDNIVEIAAAVAPVAPVMPVSPAAAPTARPGEPAKSNNKMIWIIIGVIAALILLAIVVVIVAAGVVFYLTPRT